MVSRENISSLVMLDFECTGLIGPGSKPKITELCLLSVQREEFLTPIGVPRVCNKLVLCLNPQKMIDPAASRITGLYNDALETQSCFDESVVKTISLFLSRLPSPVCLLAHNGNGFDFKILNAELKRISKELPVGLLCADSLEALRDLDSILVSKAAELINQNNGATTATPIGQTIPEVPEQVMDVKGRVRQIKRKCDPDFDRVPLEAKSIRKKLFDSAGKVEKDDDQKDSLDLTGHKVSSSMKMQADVVSKRNTCDIECVKKKLFFDDDEEEEVAGSDIEMSELVHIPFTNSSQEKTEDKQNCHLFSQESLSDGDLISAVDNLENPSNNSANDFNGLAIISYKDAEISKCLTPNRPRVSSSSECLTPKDQTVNVLSTSDGLCTPETPSTSSQHVDQLTPKKELCLTPVTTLVRSTAAFQLNTPVSVCASTSQNGTDKGVKSNSIACRSIFRENGSRNGSLTSSLFPFCPGSSPISRHGHIPSYKLGDIYKQTFGKDPEDLHSAESDCVTLMRIVKQRSPDFIQWVDEHAVLLTSVPPAY